jgi:hypothetical protein
MDRMADQFEAYRLGNTDEAALMVTTDSTATDIASASINLPVEEYYPYTASMLAEKLGIKTYQVVDYVKRLGLRGNSQHHKVIATGTKSSINKWSEKAYLQLKNALVN